MFLARKNLMSRPKLRLADMSNAPSVDVFITYCGEPVDVIIKTIHAVLALDYRKDRYRVIVLDDCKSAQLEERMPDGNCPGQVHYTARKRKNESTLHAKAANLNHGLQFAAALKGGASEYVAVLDTDQVPRTEWLSALIPHLLKDLKVGLINIPAGDPLGQGFGYAKEIREPVMDSLGMTWCTSSGFVARRKALDDIGGIPTHSLTEDALLSMHLWASDWNTAYVNEELQHGLCPNSMRAHIKQRKRFAVVVAQLIAVLWSPGLKKKKGSWWRMRTAAPALFITISVFTTTYSLVAMPVLLFLAKPLVLFENAEQLWVQLGFACLYTVSQLYHRHLVSAAAGFRVNPLANLRGV